MSELTVVWSGSMRDVYLCVRPPVIADHDRSPERRQAAKTPVMLPTCEAEAITTSELMARSGASYGVVNQVLYRLRKAGQLGWVILPASHSGRQPRAYWRKAN